MKQKVQIGIAAAISFAAIAIFSVWFMRQNYYPDRALQVAQNFVNELGQDHFSEAYALTDKTARIAPSFFSSLANFQERASRDRPFSISNPGGARILSFSPIQSRANRLKRWIHHRQLDPAEIDVEFYLQYRVKLCQQKDGGWKVCYFQMHAG